MEYYKVVGASGLNFHRQLSLGAAILVCLPDVTYNSPHTFQYRCPDDKRYTVTQGRPMLQGDP